MQPQPALVITLLNGFSENSRQPLQTPVSPCNVFLYALQIIGKTQHETQTVGVLGSLNLNTMHVSFYSIKCTFHSQLESATKTVHFFLAAVQVPSTELFKPKKQYVGQASKNYSLPSPK